MFRLCSSCVSTVLYLDFNFLDRKWICFHFIRFLFRLCSIYVSTLLEFCFDFARPMFRVFFNRNWICFDCARFLFRLCSTYISTVLDLCFDFLNQNWVYSTLPDLYFNCARPMCRLSRPKLGIFELCSIYVSTVLDLYFDVLDICLYCARLMFRLF